MASPQKVDLSLFLNCPEKRGGKLTPRIVNKNRSIQHFSVSADEASPPAQQNYSCRVPPWKAQGRQQQTAKGHRVGGTGQARVAHCGVNKRQPRAVKGTSTCNRRAGACEKGEAQRSTFELGQRRELHLAALAAKLRGALRALLPLSLAHRFPCEAIHFLRGRDGRRHGWAVRRRRGTSLSRSIY